MKTKNLYSQTKICSICNKIVDSKNWDKFVRFNSRGGIGKIRAINWIHPECSERQNRRNKGEFDRNLFQRISRVENEVRTNKLWLIEIQKNISHKQNFFKVLRLVRNWGEAEKHRKKITDYKNSILNSSFFLILYNDWENKQIRETKSIEQIKHFEQWNIWEPKTRKAKIIYVSLTSVILFVVFSIWKWNLIKKYKDWYNDPGYLDGEEENWDWLEEEEEENEKNIFQNSGKIVSNYRKKYY